MNRATWDDLANAFDRQGPSRPARTLPMEVVADWAEEAKQRLEDDFRRLAELQGGS